MAGLVLRVEVSLMSSLACRLLAVSPAGHVGALEL